MESRESPPKGAAEAARFSVRRSPDTASSGPIGHMPGRSDDSYDHGDTHMVGTAEATADIAMDDLDVGRSGTKVMAGSAPTGDNANPLGTSSVYTPTSYLCHADTNDNLVVDAIRIPVPPASLDNNSEMPDLVGGNAAEPSDGTLESLPQPLSEEESAYAKSILEIDIFRPLLLRLKSTTRDRMPPEHKDIRVKSFSQLLKERLIPIGDFVKDQTRHLKNWPQAEHFLWKYIGENYWPVAEHKWPHLEARTIYHNWSWRQTQQQQSQSQSSPRPDSTMSDSATTLLAQQALEKMADASPSPSASDNDLFGEPLHPCPNSPDCPPPPPSPVPNSHVSRRSSVSSARPTWPNYIPIYTPLFPGWNTFILSCFKDMPLIKPSRTEYIARFRTTIRQFVNNPGSPNCEHLEYVFDHPTAESRNRARADSFELPSSPPLAGQESSHNYVEESFEDEDMEEEEGLEDQDQEAYEFLCLCQAICILHGQSPDLAEHMLVAVIKNKLAPPRMLPWDSEEGIAILEGVLSGLVGGLGVPHGETGVGPQAVGGYGEEMEGILEYPGHHEEDEEMEDEIYGDDAQDEHMAG